jgi:hypothetical protein
MDRMEVQDEERSKQDPTVKQQPTQLQTPGTTAGTKSNQVIL